MDGDYRRDVFYCLFDRKINPSSADLCEVILAYHFDLFLNIIAPCGDQCFLRNRAALDNSEKSGNQLPDPICNPFHRSAEPLNVNHDIAPRDVRLASVIQETL